MVIGITPPVTISTTDQGQEIPTTASTSDWRQNLSSLDDSNFPTGKN